jgi:hypothetical protein
MQLLERRAAIDCFGAGTPILMADRTFRPIERVRPGDQVMGFEGVGPLIPCRVIAVRKPVQRPVMGIDLLLVTERQPFLTAEGAWCRAWDVGIGTRLMRADGTMHIVEHVVADAGREVVYDLALEDPHTCIAGLLAFRVRTEHVKP